MQIITNKSQKELKEHGIDFPNSLCMPIINGKAFFKYIDSSSCCAP